MTAPPRSLRNLSGKWTMSRSLSSDMSPVLALQGINFLMRKAAAAAPVYWSVRQPADGATLAIDQTTIASLPASKEEWVHDWKTRDYEMGLLGSVSRRSRWTKPGDVAAAAEGGGGEADGVAFLTDGLAPDDEVIEEDMSCQSGGWSARYVWRFEGNNLVRRLVIRKGDKKVEAKLVYEPTG